MSVFDNFDKIARMYPEVYGKEKSQKRYYNKYYLKSNPDSNPMKIYEAFNDLYNKYDNAKKEKTLMRNQLIIDLRYDLRNLSNENFLLKKEIKELKNIINNK
jgi:hypothetical protein